MYLGVGMQILVWKIYWHYVSFHQQLSVFFIFQEISCCNYLFVQRSNLLKKKKNLWKSGHRTEILDHPVQPKCQYPFSLKFKSSPPNNLPYLYGMLGITKTLMMMMMAHKLWQWLLLNYKHWIRATSLYYTKNKHWTSKIWTCNFLDISNLKVYMYLSFF
jgi:hypothetical protein